MSLAPCSSKENIMSTLGWIIVIVLVALLLGGGGYFYRR